VPEPDLVAFTDGRVRKRSTGLSSHIDLRAGARRQFLMPGNEAGVQVRFDYAADAQTILACFVDIMLDIALRIRDCGHTLGPII
jgi:hypothetical protein